MGETADWQAAEFKEWLESQTGVVGQSNSCLDCPVAKWRESKGEMVSVSVDRILIGDDPYSDPTELLTPEWVSEFVGHLDNLHCDLHFESVNEFHRELAEEFRVEPVTVAECLAVLEVVCSS